MKKILLFAVAGLLYGGEFEYGKGTFKLKGGFIGLDKEISTDINVYSLVEQHKNLFKSTWFYRYNISFSSSDKVSNSQSTIKNLSNLTFMTTPATEYKYEGLDVNLALGKDFNKYNENNYFGVSLMVGISLPYIETNKDSDNNDSSSSNIMNGMKKSKTKMYTYKIGPSLTSRYSFNDYFSIYADATYAYQTGKLKNDYINSDLDVDGIFQEYDIGFRFQPVAFDKKIGFLTISPRLYATIGYRITKWDLDDVSLDITGANTQFSATDFSMKSNVTYFGIGYSF